MPLRPFLTTYVRRETPRKRRAFADSCSRSTYAGSWVNSCPPVSSKVFLATPSTTSGRTAFRECPHCFVSQTVANPERPASPSSGCGRFRSLSPSSSPPSRLGTSSVLGSLRRPSLRFAALETPTPRVSRPAIVRSSKADPRFIISGALTAEESLAAIIHTNEVEKVMDAGTSYVDCFRGTNLRRTEIVCMVWMIQTICGSGFMYVHFWEYPYQRSRSD